MKFIQSFLFLTAYQLTNIASTYGRALDKHVKYPDTDLFLLVADQLNELETILGDKLSNRLLQLFKKYNVNHETQFNSLLETLSFLEELNNDNTNTNDVKKPIQQMTWGSRLKKASKSAGKHLKDNKYFKKALKAIIKVSMREFFIHMLPTLERVNEHSIKSLKSEFQPTFARFVFTFYDKLFNRFHVDPPVNFTKAHFQEKFRMEDNNHSIKELIPIK